MRVVEQYATPGSPRIVYRTDPTCTMKQGDPFLPCGKPATEGVYHESTGGRSHEIIYWCPEHAAWFDTETEDPATLHGSGVGIVPRDFGGYFPE